MPGIWRSVYGILGWEYNSKNDIPSEKDVKLKQVCMRQISLSKVKLNHVETKESTPPDLEKIKVNPEFKIKYKNKTLVMCEDRTYITEVKKSDPIPILPNKNNNEWFKCRERIF